MGNGLKAYQKKNNMGKRTWTNDMLEKLRNEYPYKPTRLLAKELGRSYEAIKTKATVLKLKKTIYSNNPYTKEKEDYLIKNYANTRNRDLAEILNVTEGSIQGRAFKLGLKKCPEFMERCSSVSYFKKGHIPYSKGKKQTEFMSPEAIERTKATRFQKGSLPFNYKGGEHLTKDGYIMKSLGESKKILKHKYVWENKNGKIPKGYCLWFKDGDRTNCSIENLELISQCENMLRNSKYNYPREVIPSMILVNKVKKQLNTIENGK